MLARTETAETYDTGLWRTLAAEIGVAGLLIPESLGGAGASYREAAVVAEEIGRAIAPVPFLGSAVVATTALLSAGDTELLTELAAGALTAALAVPFAAGPGKLPAPTVRLEGPQPGDEAGTYRLSGQVPGVADALPADVLLVPADGVPYGLYAVRVRDAGVGTAPVVSLDQTRQLCDITLAGAPATAGGRRPGGRGRGARRRCSQAQACWRPSSSASPSARWRSPSPTSRNGTSSPGRSAGSRRSSTGWRTCGSPSPRRARPPGPRPTGW